ncbi:DUF5812 family protein [Halomarina litorea]|uniref:DUF5812 family protein n=1 Tax=Halomarina litorea TaxID=2961595 RepID=UPI0020C59FAE|nr:DUF5812 family protein [Halomarina sp. BCD28]
MSDSEKEGRFVVTHAESDSAVLKDVDDGQVHTLGSNPGVEEGDVLSATLAPDPPLEVTWQVVEVETRRTVRIERSEEPPTTQERDIAAGQDVGDLTREERAGKGEIHVLTVPPEETEDAVSDVLDDEATVVRAARMDEVNRVEVRARDGVVSVRYLP